MAYSAEQWERAKAYYESGQYSLSQNEAKSGIGKSAISKMAKNQQWKNGANADYIEAKEIIAVKKSTLNSTVVNILDDIADERIKHKRLINSNAELLASHIPKVINSFISKQINAETGKEEEVYTLEAKTIKELAEANDKLAVTLELAPRHANQQINVNTQNNIQTNTAVLSEDEAKKKALELGVPLSALM